MAVESRNPILRMAETWRGAIRDVLLIVMSILIAFALEAWWDSRKDRSEEVRWLSDLETEFTQIKAEFDTTQAYHRRKTAAAGALRSSVENRLSISEDSLNSLWRQTLGSRTFTPSQGTVEGIIMSGKLGLIRDDTLSRLIAGWSGRVERLARAEENVRVVYRDEILPWLQDRTPMPHGAGSAFRPDLAVLLADYRLHNRIGWMVAQTDLIITEGVIIGATIDSILDHTRRHVR